MMKAIRRLLTPLLLLGAMTWAVPAAAAGLNLPDMGSSSAARAAQAQEVLKKDAVCTKCHDESENKPVLSYYQGKHGVKGDPRAPGCQGCHGASDSHVKNPGGTATRPLPDITFGAKAKSTVKEQSQACAGCHEGGKRTHWAGSQHEGRDVTCSSCHTNHAAKDKVLAKATQSDVCFSCHKSERALTHRISTHPLAVGKMGCSDCHNPHGSVGPKLLVKNTVNETCYTCHAEKRGPFLWSHASANDDCMNCHTPHGSTVAPLLKARSPWLCQQCHGGTTPHPGNVYSATGLPGGSVANVNKSTAATNPLNPVTGARLSSNNPPAQLAFRGCTNCHSQVHGSNHPSGIYLLR